ncbi:MAG: cytoplasmic protein [Candidatus Magnetomorum sp.]|nr:cytoplasmic protein [Candidatus Magnetomorum sp.]
MNIRETSSPQKLLDTFVEQNRLNGGFGAVIARAGVGKTALLVQIALYSLIQKKNVLHVSMKDSIQKVCLWYDEVSKKIDRLIPDQNFPPDIWDTILAHRMIMTFGEDRFETSTFKERLSDLTEQGIFYPQLIIIDGLLINKQNRAIFEDLKSIAKEHSAFMWFSIQSHRHEVAQNHELPPSFIPIQDLFDAIFQVIPKADTIDIELSTKIPLEEPVPELILDPETMLIRKLNSL